MPSETHYRIRAGGALSGDITVPGDKSVSHRAVMLGSIADGRSRFSGLLEGEDVLATVTAFRAMGVGIQRPQAGSAIIDGVGLHGLRAPTAPLDLGNSGTAMRLLMGVLAGQAFASELRGDASLSKRPMARVVEPLSQMGAEIETGSAGRPPVRIIGSRLHGITYSTPMASAQVKSAILLAGLYSRSPVTVIEPAVTRDHTERMLQGFGCQLALSPLQVVLQPVDRLQPVTMGIPADLSSAAFFILGATIAPGSDLLIRSVGVNPTRIGLLSILREMGADLTLSNQRQTAGELVADIRVKYAHLHGINIDENLVSLAIDELPAVAIAAACAAGQTRITGAAELRVKESDRIAATVNNLRALNVEASELDDGMVIDGGVLAGGNIDSQDDHRIAMAFAMAALRSTGDIHIQRCSHVATSFPGFAELAKSVGLGIAAC